MIVSSTIFLVSVSICWWIVHRNAIGIFVCWFFYPETLTKSLISCRSLFLYAFLGSMAFSMSTIVSLANRNSFISSFLIDILVIFFLCLIVQARTSSAMLSKNGDSGHPCLVSYHKREAFSILPWSMMLSCRVLVDVPYQVEDIPLCF